MSSLSYKRVPTVCYLQRHILSHKRAHTNTHSVRYPLAGSPWYFRGNIVHHPPSSKDTEMLARKWKKKKKEACTDRQKSMHTSSHTSRDRYGSCCFIEAPCCFYLCPRGNLPNTGSKTVPLRSPALSFITWARLSNLFFTCKRASEFCFLKLMSVFWSDVPKPAILWSGNPETWQSWEEGALLSTSLHFSADLLWRANVPCLM